MTEVTEESVGTYSCMPYNILGTTGRSLPAKLVLKVYDSIQHNVKVPADGLHELDKRVSSLGSGLLPPSN